MDLTPDTDGLIPARYAARYAQLGGVIRSCYVDQVIEPDLGACSDDGTCLYVFNTPTAVDRVVLMEDQRQGQDIRGYIVEGRVVGNYTAAGRRRVADAVAGNERGQQEDRPVRCGCDCERAACDGDGGG